MPPLSFSCGCLHAGHYTAKEAKRGRILEQTAKRDIEHLRINALRMMYATFKIEGCIIGSGVMKAGCETVVGKRAKQSGVLWKMDGTHNILNIQTAVSGGTCDSHREHRHRETKLTLAA